MTIETTVNNLVVSVDALKASVVNKRAILDTAAANADVSGSAVVASATAAQASAAAAAASATVAANTAAEVTAFKTAASALNTSTTATQAVTNLLPDMLAKQDPARYPFRGKYPSLVLDFARQSAHSYSPLAGLVRQAITDVVTFTRASTATYTGPDGLIKTAAVNEPRYNYDPLTGECKGLLVEEQRTNLVLYSRQFLSAAWSALGDCVTKPVSTLTPFGDALAHEIRVGVNSPSQVNIRAGVGLTVGSSYCASALVKAGNTAKVSLAIGRGPSIWRTDFELGVSTNAAHLGNGWYLISVLCPAADGTSGSVNIYPGNRLNNVPGEFIYVAGVQLEAGAFPTSYIPTPATFTGRTTTATYLDANGVVQTAGVGVARSNAYGYDSDGVLRPIGLLLEASATNLLLYSQDYTQAVWAKRYAGLGTAPVVTSAYGTAPDGTSTAQRVQLALNSGATVADHSTVEQDATTVAGTTYTMSVWLKTADASTKQVQLSFSGGNPTTVTVTGTWKRFSVTGTASDTGRGFRLALRGTYGTSDSADLLMWGAQHAAGYYATSYIPTTTAQVTRAADTSTSAQVTRSADSAVVTGSKFSSWYNPEQGTLGGSGYVGGTETPNAGTPRTLAAFSGAVDAVRLGFASFAGSIVYAGGVEQSRFESSAVIGNHKIAVSLKKNQMRGARDGSSNTEDTSAVMPRVNKLTVGGYGPLCGTVRRLTYYPMTMTNEELQVLTSA